MSLENIKRKTGKDVGGQAHTQLSISFYSTYHTHNAIQLFAFSLIFTKKKWLPPKKPAALVFPSTAKPAVDAGQNNYRAKEEGEAQRRVK